MGNVSRTVVVLAVSALAMCSVGRADLGNCYVLRGVDPRLEGDVEKQASEAILKAYQQSYDSDQDMVFVLNVNRRDLKKGAYFIREVTYNYGTGEFWSFQGYEIVASGAEGIKNGVAEVVKAFAAPGRIFDLKFGERKGLLKTPLYKPKPKKRPEAAADKTTPFVPIAAIDPAQAEHVAKLLERNDIPSLVEGSVVYGVSVPPTMKYQAIALLQADSEKEKYFIKLQPSKPRPTSALIVSEGIYSKEGIRHATAMSIVDDKTIQKLEAFFPKYETSPSSDRAGGWEAGYRVYFNFRKGRSVRVTVSESGDGDTWTIGEGDLRTKGDFAAFVKELQRQASR